ncbi:MAG TPA: hypothetical protein VIK35_09470 [Verrucomicrobiae bacterium]
MNGGGVHDVNEPFFEMEGGAWRADAGKAGLERLQMFQHRPEELPGHFRIAGAVGGQKIVQVKTGRQAELEIIFAGIEEKTCRDGHEHGWGSFQRKLETPNGVSYIIFPWQFRRRHRG